MGLAYPEPVVLPATSLHTASIIFLHGLGDTADGWARYGPRWQAEMPYTKFIFPTAPTRPIGLDGGGKNSTGWYDLTTLEVMDKPEDEAGLRETARYVDRLIAEEVAEGVPSTRVAIAGFSQGGVTSLMALRSNYSLAGVVSLSGYLPLATQAPEVSPANARTPIFMCHGDQDQVIAYRYGRRSFDILQTAGANVHFKTYWGIGHSTSFDELEDVVAFFKDLLPARVASPS
ncbi:hypothetical protein WJX81_006446 [Elliptochloris bilobata]|uniref:Phospholipase/carboxylesterase/thioesterase domain-containing protein n=1 Tax=Elliptochloris bilobata TaxID=381761 RepID=A0AAW1SM21_9CHLO